MNSDQQFIISDIRMKECICPTECLLEKLEKINFVSYDRIDKSAGSFEVGIIAQNVAEIFPKMVNLKNGFIPTLNKQIEHALISDNRVFFQLPNASTLFSEHDVILIFVTQVGNSHNRQLQLEILNVSDDSIEVEAWRDYASGDEAIIYGKKVEDLHVVDNTQISMLAAACAKELYVIVQDQALMIKTLQDQVAALQSRLS